MKTELISNYYKDAVDASRHIARCITIYNYRRRHNSLNWQVPEEVHKQYGMQKKNGETIITNELKKKLKMQGNKLAYTQKIPVLALDGYTGIFCQLTATANLFINQ